MGVRERETSVSRVVVGQRKRKEQVDFFCRKNGNVGGGRGSENGNDSLDSFLIFLSTFNFSGKVKSF